MAHSKAYMISEMRTMGAIIMDLLNGEDTKIKPGHLEVPEESEELRADFIRPAYKWILAIYNEEYVEAWRVKSLLPAELWKRYKSWGGFDDHREVVLLRKACNSLRTVLVSQQRPDFYKRTKYEQAKKKLHKAKGDPRPSPEDGDQSS